MFCLTSGPKQWHQLTMDWWDLWNHQPRYTFPQIVFFLRFGPGDESWLTQRLSLITNEEYSINACRRTVLIPNYQQPGWSKVCKAWFCHMHQTTQQGEGPWHRSVISSSASWYVVRYSWHLSSQQYQSIIDPVVSPSYSSWLSPTMTVRKTGANKSSWCVVCWRYRILPSQLWSHLLEDSQQQGHPFTVLSLRRHETCHLCPLELAQEIYCVLDLRVI